VIETREDLIRALQEASEIEQGLMIQYLFGAFSLKRSERENLTPGQGALVRDWKARILGVAQEEMGHLGTVCNLLSAIGAPPHFSRPNFPKATSYYPFPFDLVPFGDDFLYRLQIFELPRGAPLPPRHMCGSPEFAARHLAEAAAIVPDPVVFDRVGALYTQIADGFKRIPERELFIGPTKSQDDSNWSINLNIHQIYDRATTSAAIQRIIQDGEGTSVNTPSSHFARFTGIRKQYVEAGCFDAARAVVVNPSVRKRRDSDGSPNLIENGDTAAVCDLFNGVYFWALSLLLQYFSRAGETEAQRTELKQSAQRTMSIAIRPIAEILTELPFAAADDPRRAGPSFELAGDVYLPPDLDARWTMVMERLDAIIVDCRGLSRVAPRLGPIAETMGYMRRALAKAIREG
jgi:hypothetical protein